MPHIDRTRCQSCGEWYWAGDAHTCAPSPTDVFVDRPGTTVRFSVNEQFELDLQAVLNHPAETVVRRPAYAKEYSL